MSKVKKIKFGEQERQEVIDELESHYNIKLTPRKKRKFFAGSDGRYFYILGGAEDWHGISTEVVTFCKQALDKSYIVIARLLSNRIELYIAPIKTLIDSIHKLSRAKSGDYKFHIKKITEGRMYLNEVPDYYLEKLLDFFYHVGFERLCLEKKNEIDKILSSKQDN
jgi:hypothetical protein